MKVCRTCNKEFPIESFNKNKRQKDGYSAVCRICTKKYNKNNYRKNNPVENIPEGYKKCSRCNIIKNHIKFSIRKNNKIQSECKECRSIMHNEWRLKGGKKWENNYSKHRKQTDPEYKLRNILRLRLLDALKRQLKGGIVSNKHSAIELVGCSMIELKDHLEKKFIGDMSWSNHGIIWEIDHIIPCTWFNLNNIEEQHKCFHYTNLQPLFTTTKEINGVKYIGNRNKRNITDYKQ